ncbi:MAG: phosphoribosylformylglycinamidine cyclo-ligase [Rickettsiales bacterium]|nr:phosphoribosylformylglycinamidine cyclo-ligase [Rickettsiales bacterium]|tara:strand:+ start:658 stop:1704 length:1047 start_codon:yes stop_codon:yes gene_type:complete
MRKKKDYNFSYLKSGVNIKLGNTVVDQIKPLSKKTQNKNVIGGIGGFGAVYDINNDNFKKPLLVSATDGVGTKILIAKELRNYKTIGIDLVAMSVNDIIVQGAKPLFFLDYIAVEKIKKQQILDLINSISKGCIEANCALIGGETAELPGLYSDAKFDIAGFAVGIVEKRKLLPKKNIKANDLLLGFPSTGLHSNGYSLIRKVFNEKKVSYKKTFYSNHTFGDVLLKPTKIYVKTILELLKNIELKAIAHITGGGIEENLNRVIPKNLGATIDTKCLSFYKKNSIYNWLLKSCKIQTKEMLKTFNCGIGMIIVINKNDLAATISKCKVLRQPVKLIGKMTDQNLIKFY